MIKKIILPSYRNIRNIYYRIILKKNRQRYIYFNFNNCKARFNSSSSVYFFLNDNESMHYVDKFFFIPLIVNFSKYTKVIVIENDPLLIKILKFYNVNCKNSIPKKQKITVISYLNCYKHIKKFKNCKFIGIDLKMIDLNKNLYPLLFYEFKKLFKISFDINRDYFDKFIIFYKNLLLKKKFNFIKNKYYIYSEDLVSQSFWQLFNDSLSKMRKLAQQKSKKDTILHCSIKRNKNILTSNYLNISGKTTFEEIISLVADKKCRGIIAYDNIYVHLATIFKKEIYFSSRYFFTDKREKINNLTIPFLNNRSFLKINEIL
jgi:hypothetical protein